MDTVYYTFSSFKPQKSKQTIQYFFARFIPPCKYEEEKRALKLHLNLMLGNTLVMGWVISWKASWEEPCNLVCIGEIDAKF